MKRDYPAVCLALAVLATLGLTGPAAAQQTLPFHGSFEGDVTRIPDPPVVRVDIDASGVATHLGRFMLDVPHVVDPTTRTGDGIYYFTAANGDMLTAHFTGQATPIVGTSLLYIVETATIMGGTGRFADATGDFVAYRLFDTVGGTTVGFFDGTISLRAGGR